MKRIVGAVYDRAFFPEIDKLRAVIFRGCALSRLRWAFRGCALSRLRCADRACSGRFGSVLLAVVLAAAACSPKQDEKKAEGEHVVTVDVAPVLTSPISLKVTSDALLYPFR